MAKTDKDWLGARSAVRNRTDLTRGELTVRHLVL